MLPYKRPLTKKAWLGMSYGEYYGCILSTQNKVLSYATTNRAGYHLPKLPCAGMLHAKPAAHENHFSIPINPWQMI